MKNFFIPFLALTISSVCFSQNPYTLFNSKSEFFFNRADLNAELAGLRPDSVKVNGTDSVYYHYRVLGVGTGTCSWNAKSPSWTGVKTIRKTNGDYVFFTKQNDTILLKSLSPLNSTWKYFKYSNGDYIQATVSTIQYEPTFDGQSDTVKTVSFQAYNSSNTPITNNFNGKTIKIAKSQGIIKVADFYEFPAQTNIYTRCFGKRLTNGEILDVNAGDTLVSYYYASGNGYLKKSTISKFLTKSYPDPNTIVYTASVTTNMENGSVQSSTTSPGWTLVTTYTSSSSMQTITVSNATVYPYPYMPDQFVMAGGAFKMRYYFNPLIGNKDCSFKFMTVSSCLEAGGNVDTCLMTSVSCNTPKYNYYYRKLGWHQEQPTTPWQGSVINYPIYYSSGSYTCGEYFIVPVKEINDAPIFNVYPNPVHNRIFVDTKSSQQIIELRVTDISGREVKYTNSNSIDVSDMTAGVYFLIIKTNEKEIVRKFVQSN